MCGADPNCKCGKVGNTFKVNLSGSIVRQESLDGVQYYVIPVVMAKDDVVMNEAIIPLDQMIPETWNGVPVTVGHPDGASGEFSANTPDTIKKYCVGRIFNAKLDGNKLVGEAWIDVKLANQKFPKILQMIKSGTQMDVSTGYFADVAPANGELNGRTYNATHNNIKPDHLALLPDEVGACNWKDGCGVRTNRQGLLMSKKVKNALSVIAAALKLNADPAPAAIDPAKKDAPAANDAATVQSLIDAPNSPFMPADMDALMALSPAALAGLVEEYTSPEEVTEPAAAAADPAAVDPAKKDTTMNAAALSAEDREAIANAKQILADAKADLVAKVVANSDIKKEAAEAMDFATLKIVANGLRVAPVVASYEGRALAPIGNDGKDPAAEAMKPLSFAEAVANKKKGA